ncbi:hypothetical protein OF83DRAFT_1064404 [Amylostereum chailletii]|nr:hypothetical protein OF83DRAFT_1064404 [Amylostereum chailletii]
MGSALDIKNIPSSSSLEKGDWWDGYLDDNIPEKTQGHALRNLRHQVFYLYRRLFGVVFIANISILIATLVDGNSGTSHLGLIVIANLFVSILMRLEHVVNAFFTICCAVPLSWPLFIRRQAAQVYHIGGIHSGAATSGTAWLIVFVVQATREVIDGGPASIPTVVVSWVVLMLLLVMIALAHPRFRVLFHNQFEMVHRFLGWTATALVWAQVILLANDYRPSGQPLHRALVHSAPFWLVVVLTLSIVHPWTRLRKVTVRSEVLSSHCVRIYFDYVTPKPGSFTRMSTSPLTEWHSFATIAVPGVQGYSAVVSRAGDWTSRVIDHPPTTLWVRGIPTFGVVSTTILFRRVILVATGSGIGPMTPVILAKKIPLRLLWTAPKVRETYGDAYVDALLDNDPDAAGADTRKHGKPDMLKLSYKMYREFEAEAVCIISNEKLTRKVVYGLRSRGVPAFGAIWDS